MVADILRDSTLGNIINWASNGRLLPFPEELPDYVVPARYLETRTPASLSGATVSGVPIKETPALAPTSSRSSAATLDVEATNIEKPDQQLPDQWLVTFDGDDDPLRPQAWSFRKRVFVSIDISLLTFAVYVGSAIYTPSIPGLIQEFGLSLTQAYLGLTLYVLAYGLGPMFLSPLQEVPSLGRNPVYIGGLFLFVLFNIPIVTTNSFGVILAFRFLAGFVGSPALATGGASMTDVWPLAQVSYALATWAIGAVCGPILGPVIGGFSAMNAGWRWTIYELLMISAFALIFLALVLPETYEPTILLRKAPRLRKLTGNQKLRSQSEIDQTNMKPTEIMYDSLVRPFVLALEPMLLFANVYIGLIYSIFYLWFESFAIVFVDVYHFNLGLSGLPFVGFLISGIFTFLGYCAYTKYHLEPRYIKANYQLAPEVRLELGLFASLFIPVSMLIFGFTARESVHWIVPVIAAALYLPGIYLNFQAIVMYISFSYPHHAASVLAGNALFRSAMAAAFPLFGHAFFSTLGLGGGSALLAGISVLLMPAYYACYRWGPWLRARSKYAVA